VEIKVKKDWWKDLFDEVYLKTDARSVCDEELTRSEIDALTALFNMDPTDPILDLCGGQGRHALELSRRGYEQVTTLDYSPYLVNIGKKMADRENLSTRFIRGDARQTGLRGQSFRYIFILGSSFGYFINDDENGQILQETHRLLEPQGWLLLDLPDRSHVEKGFQPVIRHEVDADIEVTRNRALKNGIVYACETVVSKTDGCIRKNNYCTRLFSQDGIARRLTVAGFTEVQFDADYMDRSKKGNYGTMTNRMIVRARKK
jgi:D-alanine-D-alanine ligase